MVCLSTLDYFARFISDFTCTNVHEYWFTNLSNHNVPDEGIKADIKPFVNKNHDKVEPVFLFCSSSIKYHYFDF